MKERRKILTARNISMVIAIILLFLGLLMACLGCGGEKEGLEEGNYGDIIIDVMEGKWPVELYHNAFFPVLGISFDYPDGWGCYTIPGDSEADKSGGYKGSGDYDNEFINVYIEKYAEEAPSSFNIPENTSLDLGLKLSKDNIAGIKIYESKQSLDLDTGLFHGYISAVEPKKKIVVEFKSDEGRSLEEYTSVINQFINTLEIDFNKMLLIPII